MGGQVIVSARKLTVVRKGREVLRPTDLDINRGEIHAIVGDHNAGKSLLAELFSGSARYDGGDLFYDGKLLSGFSPVKARALGIVTIHQNPRVFNSFDVLDNIILSRGAGPLPSRRENAVLAERAREKLGIFGVEVDLHTPIWRCSDSDIQVIYIVRGLCEPCSLLIVDDVCAHLSAAQVETLQSELSLLREKGVTILYFTSNVEEVYQFADKVSFLQNGSVLATEVASSLGKLELVQLSYSHLYSRKELERNNYELFYLKNYYENIINSMPVPLLLINSEMRIIHMNNKFSETMGVPKERYIGSGVVSIFREGSSEQEYFSQAALAGDSQLRHFPDPAMAVGGSSGALSLYKIPIYDEDNSFLGSILYFDAMSMKVDLEQYNRNIQAMKRVPFFAHEIRNPLAILNNFITLIKEKSSSQEIKEYLGRSEKEIRRINAIIDNLMKEQGRVPNQTKPAGTRIWLLVEEVRYLFMPMIGDNRITVMNRTEADLYLAYDEDELKEVLINLVLNAIEAITLEGSIELESAKEILNGKPYSIIRVRDNGRGIDPENLKRIFTPFFSTKSGKERRGLGLPICKDIIDTWGGMITAESVLGSGSTFSIFLPA